MSAEALVTEHVGCIGIRARRLFDVANGTEGRLR
jgi:hypothetical protein